MSEFCKKPCKHCPFRNDVKPFLHPDRAAEIAYAAENPYSSFPCHKTTEHDEDSEDGEMLVTENSKECAGFLTLRAQTGLAVPEGFEPSWEICYTDSWEMIDAYEEEWENKRNK
jgi:hypothetical protein